MNDVASVAELRQFAAAALIPGGRENDAEFIRAEEGRLLDGIDQRRRFEEWRFGVRLRLTFRGFERRGQAVPLVTGGEEVGTVLEIRADVRPESPDDGGIFHGRPGGGFYHWPGPKYPLPAEGFLRVEDLPKRGEYGDPKGDVGAA